MPVAYGVFVGINYERTSAALRGCMNDARNWYRALGSHCIETALLLEDEASRQGIIGTLTKTLAKLKAGDWLVFTFSGHGTQVKDASGDEQDGKDEAICPYDYQKSLILDDEIRAVLSRRNPESFVLAIMDCCHSGTNLKALDMAPRSLDWSEIPEEAKLLISNDTRGAAGDDGVMLISGCDSSEVSFDITENGVPCGALTSRALAAWKDLAQGATYGFWYQKIRKELPSSRYRQTPQFEPSPAHMGQFPVIGKWQQAGNVPPPPDAAWTPDSITMNGATYDKRK
ncbi:MAG: caspase family protein [Hyphomicrobiaceae bacterium]|nr:MAG: caspase family protein [Hyphomicrobiaceae bacterium]